MSEHLSDELIVRVAFGRAAPVERLQVEDHAGSVEGCPACIARIATAARARVETLTQVIDRLKQIGERRTAEGGDAWPKDLWNRLDELSRGLPAEPERAPITGPNAKDLLGTLHELPGLSDAQRARLVDPMALALATEILFIDAATWAEALTGTPEALVEMGYVRGLVFGCLAVYLREGRDPLPKLRQRAADEERLGDALNRPRVTLADVVHHVEAALREDGAE